MWPRHSDKSKVTPTTPPLLDFHTGWRFWGSNLRVERSRSRIMQSMFAPMTKVIHYVSDTVGGSNFSRPVAEAHRSVTVTVDKILRFCTRRGRMGEKR